VAPDRARSWTFLSNHGHVLLALAEDPDARIRDVAERVGITERAAQLIIGDLVTAGYLTRHRVGRRNTYRISAQRPFRHPAESGRLVDDLVAIFRRTPPAQSEPDPEPTHA
jgi:predicted ArsR family transcriptional regulator